MTDDACTCPIRQVLKHSIHYSNLFFNSYLIFFFQIIQGDIKF